jgi:hypothetical protein
MISGPQSTGDIFLIMQHLAVHEPQSAKKLLHLGLVAGD